jgi:hypothetical protein
LFNSSLNEIDQLFTWLYNTGKLFGSLYNTIPKLDEQRINEKFDSSVQSVEFVKSNKNKNKNKIVISRAVIKNNFLKKLYTSVYVKRNNLFVIIKFLGFKKKKNFVNMYNLYILLYQRLGD